MLFPVALPRLRLFTAAAGRNGWVAHIQLGPHQDKGWFLKGGDVI